MKWNNTDLEKYIQAKEFIDTVIIPLQPFQMENDSKLAKEAFQREVLSIFVNEIEKELSGRVLVIPEFNYLSSNMLNEVEKLNVWIEELNKQPFKTIILMTYDSGWKKIESDLTGQLLWLPGIHSGDINSPEMKAIIKGQVQQISELIRSYW